MGGDRFSIPRGRPDDKEKVAARNNQPRASQPRFRPKQEVSPATHTHRTGVETVNRILKLTALALLTLIVLSPLVTAGSPTFSHKPGFGSGGNFNHNFNKFNNFNRFNTFSTGGATFNTGKPFFGTTGFGTTNFNFGNKRNFQFNNDFIFHRGHPHR